MIQDIILSGMVLLLVFLSGLFSGAEMGLYCLNRIRLRLRAARPDQTGARLLLQLTADEPQTVLAILISQNVAGYLVTVTASFWLVRTFRMDPGNVEYYAAAILAPVVFTLGDVVPKNWFQIESDRLMYPIARLLYAGVALIRCTGVVWVLNKLSRVVSRYVGPEDEHEWTGPRGDMVTMLREGAAAGVLSSDQSQFVENIMSLSTVRVGEIMIPAARVASVSVTATRAEFQRLVRNHDHSRVPVLSRDGLSVVGIVNVNDVLSDEGADTVESWMEPVLEVSASESASSVLVRMRQAKASMAVVNDPRRGYVGIITLKDVVEEIFGELSAW